MHMNRHMTAAFLTNISFFNPVAYKGLVTHIRAASSASKSIAIMSHCPVGYNFGNIFKTMPFSTLWTTVTFVPQTN